MKFLVYATDVIPLAGLPTSGTALRTYGLIRGLEELGHSVIVSVPRPALEGLLRSFDITKLSTETQRALKELSRDAFDPLSAQKVLQAHNPDAIICGHWPAMCLRTKPSQPLIIDLAGPHLLERHYLKTPDQQAAVMVKLGILATADYFIVSGPSQRLYFLSFLIRAKIDHPEKRILTVPMPLDPRLPTPRASAPAEYPHFTFGGVFLPWQDPSWSLGTVSREISRRNQGKLTLIGGRHPNYDISAPHYDALFEELGRNPRVDSKPMLPYDKFIDELMGKDVAVDLMSWNLERELAITIRSTTYLWSGLPVIYNDYADLGLLIEQYNAGWRIHPGNEDSLARVLEEIYSSPEKVREKSLAAQRLARDHFSWTRAAESILSIIDGPKIERMEEIDLAVGAWENAELFITRDKPVRQIFLSRIDGLARVECMVATHGRTLDEPLTLNVFQFANSEASKKPSAADLAQAKRIASCEIQPEQIVDNSWLAVDFEPVGGSAGSYFCIEMSAQSSSSAQAISPWAARSNPFPMRKLYHGDREVPYASLCLRTVCSPRAVAKNLSPQNAVNL